LDINKQPEGSMDMKINDLVTFKKGLYLDEEGAVYRVLEINGDREFWKNKLEGNIKRDKNVSRELRKITWKVVRVREHELKYPEKVVAKLKKKFDK
jgi:G:T-mismatch repair DNA endonuclease (very short patch repair protein)